MLLNQSPSSVWRQRLLLYLELTDSTRLANRHVSASRALRLQAHITMPGFLHGCQGLNWGPRASTAGTFLAEPSWYLWVSSFLTNDNYLTVLVLPPFFCGVSHMNFHAHIKSVFNCFFGCCLHYCKLPKDKNLVLSIMKLNSCNHRHRMEATEMFWVEVKHALGNDNWFQNFKMPLSLSRQVSFQTGSWCCL